MQYKHSIYRVVCASVFVAGVFVSDPVNGTETLSFSPSDAGQHQSIEWGIDTALPSRQNMLESVRSFGGAEHVDAVRMNFQEFARLQPDGSLDPSATDDIDFAADIAKIPGDKPITLTPDTANGTNEWYLNPDGGVRPQRYADLISTTAHYLQDEHGLTVDTVEVWNEPDFWDGQPTASQFASIVDTLKDDPLLQDANMMGPSTLAPNTSWYDQIRNSINQGSTHKLGGTAEDYVNFIQHVQANGDSFHNPEIHSMAEMLMGAEYGMKSGIFWASARNARGKLVRATRDGYSLGYADDRDNETAAAVYRDAGGNLRAFAGGFERQGSETHYRVVSEERDVYFDGVGPIREYMVKAVRGTQGHYVDIKSGADAIGLESAFDGNQWKIVNRATGEVLQIADAATSEGAVATLDEYDGDANQRWNISRDRQGYYALFNANSGLTLEVAGSSTDNGATARQWGTADALTQQWTIESAGNGYFHLLNGNSFKFLTGDGDRSFQFERRNSALQQWQFVRVNRPTGSLEARFNFTGNLNNAKTGGDAGVAFGKPTFGFGPTRKHGRALSLDGEDDHVRLPNDIANSDDITVSSWVRWDGGDPWQRIFDFGNNQSEFMMLTPRSGDGTMRFEINTGESTAFPDRLDTDPLPTGEWTHLAITLENDTGILYVDGEPRVAGQIELDPSDFDPSSNYIGRSQFADPLFDGLIDDFRVYDYALDRSQVARLVPTSHFAWTGAAGSTWSTAALESPKNWELIFKGTEADYADGKRVLFDDAAESFTVNVPADVSPRHTTFHNTTAYTLTGPAGITGEGGLTKKGLGELNINNANTYTGETIIQSGTVNLNGSLTGSDITVKAATFTQSTTGAIAGGVDLTNRGLTELAGDNALDKLRVTGPGTVSVTDGATDAAGQIFVGDRPGDDARLTVSGGTLNAKNTVTPSLFVGTANTAQGTLAITGGVVRTQDELVIGFVPGSTGTVNLSGGALVTREIAGGAGASTFNFDGGTLRANAATDTLLEGLSNVYVKQRGAIIDTNGFAVELQQPLLRAPGLENSGSALGGLTKQGAGMLTLTGENTYSGPTRIEAGTLAIDGDHTGRGNYTVMPNGTLAVGDLANPGSNNMTIGGELTVRRNGSLLMGLANTSSDQLTVDGKAVFANDATLDIALADGFSPTSDQTWDLLKANAITDNGLILNSPADLTYKIRDNGESDILRLLVSQLTTGDMNGDGEVNNLDINPFVLALTDEEAFKNQFDADPATVGDINGDGQLNNLDINPFVELLTEGSTLQTVPEPASVAVLALGGLSLLRRRRHVAQRRQPSYDAREKSSRRAQ